MMEAWEPTLTDLSLTYDKYFTLDCLNVSFEEKFALISLICFLTKQAQKKNNSVTVEQVIRKIAGNSNSNGLLMALTCICGDFIKHCDKFPIFGAKSSKEIVDKVKELLNTELPFNNPYGQSPF